MAVEPVYEGVCVLVRGRVVSVGAHDCVVVIDSPHIDNPTKIVVPISEVCNPDDGEALAEVLRLISDLSERMVILSARAQKEGRELGAMAMRMLQEQS